MDAKLRIVTQLPIRELWRDDGFSTLTRGKSLTHDDVRDLLASGPVQFVVADVGIAPRWIPASECFAFWKNEAKPHLASGTKAYLDKSPDAHCYFASRWEGETTEPIVLLEKHH